MIPALSRLSKAQRAATLHASLPEANTVPPTPLYERDSVAVPGPQVRALRASVVATLHDLAPYLGPVDANGFRVRQVPAHAFHDLLQSEPFFVAARSLHQRFSSRNPLRSLWNNLRWGRGDGAWVQESRGAAYLPDRREIVVVSELDTPAEERLRLPVVMAALHQRHPGAFHQFLEQWALSAHFEPYRLLPEISPEVLLCVSGSCNAWGRLAWLEGLAQLLCDPQRPLAAPRRWAGALSRNLGYPAALLRKMAWLFDRDQEGLWRSLDDAHIVDALARGSVDTGMFVPFGQSEVAYARVVEIERHCGPDENLIDEECPIYEYAPNTHGGMLCDSSNEPLAAAEQLLQNGFCPRAEPLIERHLTWFPDDPEALLLQARTLQMQARYDEAAALCRRILQKDETSGMAHFTLRSIESSRVKDPPEHRHNASIGWVGARAACILAPLRG